VIVPVPELVGFSVTEERTAAVSVPLLFVSQSLENAISFPGRVGDGHREGRRTGVDHGGEHRDGGRGPVLEDLRARALARDEHVHADGRVLPDAGVAVRERIEGRVGHVTVRTRVVRERRRGKGRRDEQRAQHEAEPYRT
jgi:hypothetical protein